MGETVEALGYKADVPEPGQGARCSGKVTSVKEIITGADRPSTRRRQAGAPGGGAGVAQENPLGLAIGAVAVGFLAGMLIPSTRVENEKIGPMADQVKDKAKETGQEAIERGKHVAQQAAQSAKETAQQAGQEQAEGLRDSAQQKADETRQQVGSSSQS